MIDLVRRCIEKPDAVTRDRGYENRRCFYLRVSDARAVRQEFLKVVVEYKESEYEDSEGIIVTAYPTDTIHPEEEPL
jgi:hypothetical protein